MPLLENFIIGPIAGVYVGDSDDLGPLVEVPAPRTQGGQFLYEKPEEWEVADNNFRQVELCKVTMELTFFWSEEAYRIAMTNSLSAVNLDDAPTGQQYTVLLLVPEEDSLASILLEVCSARCAVVNNFEKTDATRLPVTFEYRERNKQIQIVRRGTYSDLATILGARSPI